MALQIQQRNRLLHHHEGLVGFAAFAILLPDAEPAINNDLSDPLEHLNQRVGYNNHVCIVGLIVTFDKTNFMDAITIFKNEANNHRLMQIDLDLLARDEQQLEDVYDIIAVELRKNEESVPWEQVKQQLHNEGKL
jgi:hypothetical protein